MQQERTQLVKEAARLAPEIRYKLNRPPTDRFNADWCSLRQAFKIAYAELRDKSRRNETH